MSAPVIFRWLPLIGSTLALLGSCLSSRREVSFVSTASFAALFPEAVRRYATFDRSCVVAWVRISLAHGFPIILLLDSFTLVDGIHRPIDRMLHLMINRQGVLLRSIFSSLEGTSHDW